VAESEGELVGRGGPGKPATSIEEVIRIATREPSANLDEPRENLGRSTLWGHPGDHTGARS
jgi:hypothetical protein